jgi:hypothetical protein
MILLTYAIENSQIHRNRKKNGGLGEREIGSWYLMGEDVQFYKQSYEVDGGNGCILQISSILLI